MVIGEGGSGGALALGLADVILMQENAIYSVIAPEGAAAILLRDATQKDKLVAGLKLRAHDLLEQGVIDAIVPEPTGGAQRDYDAAARLVMERTDHIHLVGKGAQEFAVYHGFKLANLLTEKARKQWLKWKENLSEKDDWFPPENDDYDGGELIFYDKKLLKEL